MDIDYQKLLWWKIKAERQFNQRDGAKEPFLTLNMNLWYYGLLCPRKDNFSQDLHGNFQFVLH